MTSKKQRGLMNKYEVWQDVRVSDRSWLVFMHLLESRCVFCRDMEYSIPGMWSSKVAKICYNQDADEVSIMLETRNDPEMSGLDAKILIQNMRNVGWEFIEGFWSDEVISVKDL